MENQLQELMVENRKPSRHFSKKTKMISLIITVAILFSIGGYFGIQFMQGDSDPLAEIMGGKPAGSSDMKGDFFGAGNKEFSKYDGPIPNDIANCMENEEAYLKDFGWQYYDDKVLAHYSPYFTQDNQQDRDDIFNELKPVFGYAIANNQINWEWDSNTKEYIFHTYPGDQVFWSCYLWQGTTFFNTFFDFTYYQDKFSESVQSPQNLRYEIEEKDPLSNVLDGMSLKVSWDKNPNAKYYIVQVSSYFDYYYHNYNKYYIEKSESDDPIANLFLSDVEDTMPNTIDSTSTRSSDPLADLFLDEGSPSSKALKHLKDSEITADQISEALGKNLVSNVTTQDILRTKSDSVSFKIDPRMIYNVSVYTIADTDGEEIPSYSSYISIEPNNQNNQFTCEDIDGDDPYQYSNVTYLGYYGGTTTVEDSCAKYYGYYGSVSEDVESCTGEYCYIAEKICDGNNMTTNFHYCENGCNNGKCLAEGRCTMSPGDDPLPFMLADDDSDGILNPEDNCCNIVNPDQTDNNGNGIGDACEDYDLPYIHPVIQ